ncbi:haloacid dehalogenase type II [Euzebya tangerina]|uniref:haloacid dehalogenase type II n=1 Tax=Euzebya tangerina TaxID=591198 RepID=UPI000E319CF8|nr:haloacid dehalogenase type II [Euzebya tangerina]
MSVIVFDVNETLLDLSGLESKFDAAFDEQGDEMRRLWFARLLHTSSVMTQLGLWDDFGVIGKQVLVDLADRMYFDDFSPAQAEDIVGTMRELPAHDDVVGGLRILKDTGSTLVALTNSGQSTAEAQIKSAGIDSYFEQIISVEAVRKFKPDIAVYNHCAAELGAEPSDVTLVAAHDWDCAGAMAAGWKAAFVRREGQGYNPALPAPTYREDDMISLARTLIDKGCTG